MPLQPLARDFRGKYPNASIASYDYKDVADGTGVIIFYPTIASDSVSEKPMLSTQKLARAQVTSNGVWNGNDTDYDLTAFNTPRTIKGNAYFTGWFYVPSSSYTMTAQLKVVSGGVETDISAQITSQTFSASQGFNMKLPITSEVQLKAGDVLRLTLSVAAGTGGPIIDPLQIYATNPTAELHVPFRIDV